MKRYDFSVLDGKHKYVTESENGEYVKSEVAERLYEALKNSRKWVAYAHSKGFQEATDLGEWIDFHLDYADNN